MATMKHTVRVLLIVVGVLALTAPAAFAHPIGLGPQQSPPQLSTPAAPTVSVAPVTRDAGSGFSWTDASLGAAAVGLIALVGITGERLRGRNVAHV
jgi:hypothetical protein